MVLQSLPFVQVGQRFAAIHKWDARPITDPYVYCYCLLFFVNGRAVTLPGRRRTGRSLWKSCKCSLTCARTLWTPRAWSAAKPSTYSPTSPWTPRWRRPGPLLLAKAERHCARPRRATTSSVRFETSSGALLKGNLLTVFAGGADRAASCISS